MVGQGLKPGDFAFSVFPHQERYVIVRSRSVSSDKKMPGSQTGLFKKGIL